MGLNKAKLMYLLIYFDRRINKYWQTDFMYYDMFR